jgi:hypothetical protein
VFAVLAFKRVLHTSSVIVIIYLLHLQGRRQSLFKAGFRSLALINIYIHIYPPYHVLVTVGRTIWEVSENMTIWVIFPSYLSTRRFHDLNPIGDKGKAILF